MDLQQESAERTLSKSEIPNTLNLEKRPAGGKTGKALVRLLRLGASTLF